MEFSPIRALLRYAPGVSPSRSRCPNSCAGRDLTQQLSAPTIPLVRNELASGSRLFTIGYQGRTLPELVARLRARSVQLLVDVRQVARSRRPEFNHRRLAEALEQGGIRYQHLPELGSPRGLRRALYASGDFERFAGLYLAYVRRWRVDDVADLARLVRREGVVCILCYEGEAERCHRHIVAAETLRAKSGRALVIEHL